MFAYCLLLTQTSHGRYDYNPSVALCCRRCQPPALRFGGTHALRVTRAPEPSTIVWENLDTPACERCCRRTVSFFVTLVLLFICALVFATGQAQRKRFSTQCFNDLVCEFELPATYYQVRACARACVRACVCVCVRACAHAPFVVGATIRARFALFASTCTDSTRVVVPHFGSFVHSCWNAPCQGTCVVC